LEEKEKEEKRTKICLRKDQNSRLSKGIYFSLSLPKFTSKKKDSALSPKAYGLGKHSQRAGNYNLMIQMREEALWELEGGREMTKQVLPKEG
jgi:hypothetical protein